jgi:hypothetical protein
VSLRAGVTKFASVESYSDDDSFYLGQLDTDFCSFPPREEGWILSPDLVEYADVRCQPSGHDSIEIVGVQVYKSLQRVSAADPNSSVLVKLI